MDDVFLTGLNVLSEEIEFIWAWAVLWMITFTQISYMNQYFKRLNTSSEKKETITISNLAWKRLMNQIFKLTNERFHLKS